MALGDFSSLRACRNASTVVDEWGFMEALMTDEAQTHAVVKVEYDTVMEKLGAAAASGSLSAEDAKQLAQSELDARLKAEKEALMAKEQLTAAEVRHCETLLYPRKRLKPHASKGWKDCRLMGARGGRYGGELR